MTDRVGIINYGAGNTGSIINMLCRIGAEATIISDPDELGSVDRLILPGVGHYDFGVTELKRRGLFARLQAHDGQAQPLLGICLGMQLLMSGSEEGEQSGLDLVPGTCRRFDPAGTNQKVPHMGWNFVDPTAGSSALAAQALGSRYYFVHSYHADPEDKAHWAGSTQFIQPFCSAIDSGSGILGYQFHPEKSHRFGMALLNAFVNPEC